MKNVVHIGPISSLGGMSSVIRLLSENPPEGWSSEIVDTYSNSGTIAKINAIRGAKKKLMDLAKIGDVDIAHIHVTHSFSWWRKKGMMRLCDKLGIRVIVHIHSGKFDSFCKGFAGLSVKRELLKEGRKIVVLEERWLRLLENWIPRDSVMIPNSVNLRENIFIRKTPTFPLKILMLSRGARVKGHDFALDVHKFLKAKKIPSKLIIAGVEKSWLGSGDFEGVEALGWVSEEEKRELLRNSDFMLSPSEYEGSSITVIESIANGIPCICSPTSAETIGIEDLVIDLDDPEKWAERIEELSNPASYGKILQRLEKQREKFDLSKARENWRNLYSDVIS